MRTPTRSLSNSRSTVHRFSAAVTASVLALATLTPSVASAQQESTVDPTPKGIIGGALLGAELGTIVESIAGVHSPWVYVITDIVLGAGGAVGGWEVEQTSSDAKAPVFMLAGGVGLIIPAVVLTLNATRYRSSDYATEDHAPTNAPPANPGTPGGSIVGPAPAGAPPPPPPTSAPPSNPPSTPAPSGAPPAGTSSRPGSGPGNGANGTAAGERVARASLFNVSATGLHIGVPVPEVRPLFAASELRQYGLAQQTEVRMSLVKIAF